MNQVSFSLEEIWAQVDKAVQEGDKVARKFSHKRKLRVGMQALFPTDYQAAIFVSNGAVELRLRKLIEEMQAESKFSAAGVPIIICSSLFGNTGSQAYLPLVGIISTLSKDLKVDSITSLLFDTEVVRNTFFRQNMHTNRANLFLWEIHSALWKEKNSNLDLEQFLVSQRNEKSAPETPLDESALYQVLAQRISKILLESDIPLEQLWNKENSQGVIEYLNDSQLKVSLLTESTCLEARDYLKGLPEYEQEWLKQNY